MYLISDAIYGLVFYVIGYRKQVVMKNLLIAFPEKTEKERVRIAKDFYHNFIDTFIEIIKLMSVSEKELVKRFSSNYEVVDALYDTGVNVQLHGGHFFNWEFINLGLSRKSKFPFVVVYMPVSNKSFERLIIEQRTRYGTILVPATQFKTKFHEYVKSRYALALVADQNPGSPDSAYWTPFFNRVTAFVSGPEKGAKLNNTAVVFGDFYKVKRGYYRIDFELVTTTPREMENGEITKKYVAFLEKTIRKNPANYLWSHRRWKWDFDQEKHGHLLLK
jgi:KDO2-lipid IV(A) lauroyltransferase